MSRTPPGRRWFSRVSLSVRISGLLMLATLLPLLVTVLISEQFSRPALTDQARNAMESDARTRVQLIDTYFKERVLDAETLSQVATVQQYLATPRDQVTQFDTLHTSYALVAGQFRDKNYQIWSLFDTTGNLRLFYPQTAHPAPHGKQLVPPDLLRRVMSGHIAISPVYYNPATNTATIEIYAPIQNVTHTQLVGFMRSTLSLAYIWNIVNGDKGNNGKDSYAFILDQNGIRIADTSASRLFTAIAAPGATVQQGIASDKRYGTTNPVPVIADTELSAILNQNNPGTSFQATPAQQTGKFQIARVTTDANYVSWSYFVLSPLSTVTAIADQQLRNTILVMFGVLLLAAVGGILLGNGISRPIMRSVEDLQDNSRALNTLATKQQGAASEQAWVVDSSQVGLQSVDYYSNATRVAARQLTDLSNELAQNWQRLDQAAARNVLSQIITTAQYIENATHYQTSSNQKLATAIKVTTQVTDQLVTGATSATDAANQLERVVNDLKSVVGK